MLADPDIPRKWERGEDDKVVRCLYGNVCKALDESFKKVRCTLWPKSMDDAPESTDAVPPEWPEGGAGLRAEYNMGRVLLTWRGATDNEQVYGYEVLRGERGGPMVHHTSVRAASTRLEDARVVGGVEYRYALRPYDLAGNRGPVTPSVPVSIPDT
jgi:hypothetical protein